MFFKIGNEDYSACVNALKVESNANYTTQTNARGNTVVEYINTKRKIDVGIIPLDDAKMLALQQAIASFNVSISFLNPATNELAENVNVIIPANAVEYYTIQAGNKTFKACNLQFIEL